MVYGNRYRRYTIILVREKAEGLYSKEEDESTSFTIHTQSAYSQDTEYLRGSIDI